MCCHGESDNLEDVAQLDDNEPDYNGYLDRPVLRAPLVLLSCATNGRNLPVWRGVHCELAHLARLLLLHLFLLAHRLHAARPTPDNGLLFLY